MIGTIETFFDPCGCLTKTGAKEGHFVPEVDRNLLFRVVTQFCVNKFIV